MPQILQISAVLLATLGTGAATVKVMQQDVPDMPVPEGNWTAGHALDGRSFHIKGTDLDSGDVLEDEVIFRDGRFQSVNCQVYCDFGWSEYRTKMVGDAIHFTARTECPDAPHTVVWYGTVTDDAIRIDGTWTTRRWYWTHQIRFTATETDTPTVGAGGSG